MDDIRSRRLFAVAAAVLTITSIVAPLAAAEPGAVGVDGQHGVDEPNALAEPVVDRSVARTNGTTEVVVRMGDVDLPALAASADPIGTLRTHATESQASLVAYADATDGVEVRNRFWIANAVLLEVDADRIDLDDLAARRGVERIHANHRYEVPETDGSDDPTGLDGETTYGLDQLGAPAVWDEHGTRGAGAKVAVLDTGVDASHPDVELYTSDPGNETYPGGWAEFDGDGNAVEGSTPYDSSDHGTHVSGTVAGGDASGTAIGVAPDAELLHGLVLSGGRGSFAQIAAGIEWAVEEDADVVSMSLGGDGFHGALIEPIRAAERAGTIVVAAAGNAGPETSGSPGNIYDSVAVGASDENREIGYFSSGDVVRTDRDWGDQALDHWPDEYVVPDVSAPGVDVVSALPDGEYGEKDGTSMATPHVSGVIALMVSAAGGDLSPEEIEAALVDSATKPDDAPDEKDTRYGHGIVDAMTATTTVAAPQGVTGSVADADGDPIADATIEIDGDARTITDDGGEYLARTLPGTYDVTATTFGYEPSTTAVEVVDEEFATADFALESRLEAEVTDPQDEKLEAGDRLTVAFRTAHADSLAVEAAGDYDGAATLFVDGEERQFGDPVAIDPTVGHEVVVEVETEAGTDGTLALEHTLARDDETTTLETGPTDVVSEPIFVGVVDDAGSEHAAATAAAIEARADVEYFVDVVSTAEATADVDDYGVFVVHRVDDGLEAFVDATSHPETGVVYLDQWGDTSNGVTALSEATRDPVLTGQTAENPPPAYEVVADHPVFDGLATVGESIAIHTHPRGALAWFDRFGGTTLAAATDDGGTVGTGVAVDESSQTILVSSLGRSPAVRNSHVTTAADDLLANAVAYANTLPPAWFESTQPDRIDPGDSFDVDLVADDVAELRVDLDDSSTVAASDLTLSIDGEERALGEWYDVGNASGTVTVGIGTANETVGAIDLAIGVRDAGGEEIELLGGPTAVYAPPLVVPEDVDTIQEAVDLAPAGATVEVDAGTYTAPVEITTPDLTLTARGDERPVLDVTIPGFYEPAIHVDAPNVTVERLDVVTDGLAPNGIEVDRRNATIRHVSVADAAHGVLVGGSDSDAHGTVVHDVAVEGSSDILARGIAVDHADDVVVANATVTGQRTPVGTGVGIDVVTAADAVVENNVVTDSVAGVALANARDGRVLGNEIDGSDVGVRLELFTLADAVAHNEISNAEVGVYVEGMDAGGPIHHNEIRADYGVQLERGDAAALEVERNDLSAANVTVVNRLEETLHAPLNYHGDRAADEAFVSGTVTYEPFLTAPPAEVDDDPTRIAVDLLFEAGETYGVAVPGAVDGTAADLFADGFEGVVYGFDVDDGAWTQVRGDDEIGALEALAVVAETDGRMTISHHHSADVPPVPGQRTLVEGWNFIGVPQYGDLETAYDLGTATPSLAMDPFAAPADQPGDGGGFDGTYRFGESNDSPAASPYEGYFVFVEEAGIVPSSLVPNPTADELYQGIGLYSDSSAGDATSSDDADDANESATDAETASIRAIAG